MSKVMLTINHRPTEPKLQDLMQKLQLNEDEVDMEYGVQLIDPVAGDYVILVEEAAALRVSGEYPEEVSGPYADVKIETFGPPE